MKSSIYIAVMGLITLMACETIEVVNLPERDAKMTLNALIGADSVMRITLHASAGVMETGELKEIEEAIIEVSGSDGSSAVVSSRTFNFFTTQYEYVVPLKPKPKVVYTVTARAEGFPPVIARTEIPPKVPVERVDTSSVVVNGFKEGQLSIHFDDPAGVVNYYELKFYALVFVPDSIVDDPTYSPIIQEVYAYSRGDDFFGGQSSNQLLFSDELFDGKNYVSLVNYYNEFGGDTAALMNLYSTYLITELRSLSSDYYQFRNTYSVYQRTNGDPFAQPVQVYSNVDGGFGIFAGYSSSYDTVQLSQGVYPSPLDDK